MKKIILVLLSFFAFAPFAFAGLSFIPTSETIGVGNTLSIGFNSAPNVQSNGNPAVVSASVNGTTLFIKGLAAGSADILVCDNSDCANITVRVSGRVLGANTSAHSAGSWIRSSANKRIYFISSQGLIPVKTDKIMASNGGSNGLVKAANAADLTLPVLDWMVLKDPRVK